MPTLLSIKEIKFSPRQLEIMKLASSGKTGKAISLELGISKQTVKNHMTRAYAKLFETNRQRGKRYMLLTIRFALASGQLNWEELQDVENHRKS